MRGEEVLQVTDAVLGRLDEGRIAYVHWKSNEHLAAALRGETDLDLLVDPSDRDRFIDVVTGLGFQAVESPKERRLPGLESLIGFDDATGSLVHLDVHYRVVLGEQFLKNHHLPVETWLLSDPARHAGVSVPQPERELLLLYIRSALKTKSRSLVRAAVRGGSPLPQNIRREARWLAELADLERFPSTVGDSGLDIDHEELAEFQSRAFDDDFDWRYVLATKRSLLKRLESYERLPWYTALLKRGWLRLRSGRLMRRLGLGLPRRHLPTPAPVIAVVGADGSGKTRLTRDLEAWLGAKLVVHHVYFGQPKSGLVFRALNKPGSLARNRARAGGDPGLMEGAARYTDAAKWLWLASLRRRKASRARARATRGEIVIAERFPLDDFHDMESPMDGPRLQPDGPFARFELGQYKAIGAPDLTLVMDTSLETLRERKIDLTLEEHIPKVEAVAALAEAPGRVRIDTERPYEEVLLEAKRVVWRALHESG